MSAKAAPHESCQDRTCSRTGTFDTAAAAAADVNDGFMLLMGSQSSLCDVQDKKKIEADEPVFGLASVDLVEVEAPTWHIAQHLPAIRWVPLHCICHHCMAPQTWHSTCLPSGGSHCTASVSTAWLLRHGSLLNTCLPSGGSPLHCICHHCMAPQTWHIAQHLPAIRWVPLHRICHHCMASQTSHNAQHLPIITIESHCMCHHCMAPQVWLIAQHLPAIKWVPLHCICWYWTASWTWHMAHQLPRDGCQISPGSSVGSFAVLNQLSAAMKGCLSQQ